MTTALLLAASTSVARRERTGRCCALSPCFALPPGTPRPVRRYFRSNGAARGRGNYCLASDTRPLPLHCWTQAAAGEHRDSVIVTRISITGSLNPTVPKRLSVVKWNSAATDQDRRRARRSRHVWDVL